MSVEQSEAMVVDSSTNPTITSLLEKKYCAKLGPLKELSFTGESKVMDQKDEAAKFLGFMFVYNAEHMITLAMEKTNLNVRLIGSLGRIDPPESNYIKLAEPDEYGRDPLDYDKAWDEASSLKDVMITGIMPERVRISPVKHDNSDIDPHLTMQITYDQDYKPLFQTNFIDGEVRAGRMETVPADQIYKVAHALVDKYGEEMTPYALCKGILKELRGVERILMMLKSRLADYTG